MTTIDWTKPVETTETPPRPVRVLATDGPCAKFPVIAIIDNAFHREFSLDGRQDEASHVIPLTLRNVAPKPVRYSLWMRLFYDGTYEGPFIGPPRQKIYDDSFAVEIPWNSDGSPVEEDPVRYGVCETCVEKAVKSADEWRAKAEALQAEVERLKHMPRCTHEDEIARMRQVYDAAVEAVASGMFHSSLLRITAAVRAAQQTKLKESRHD